ncbi:hypothetical protein PAXRUDRAFT_176130, partial [Paxillus rubicundulus Ve08.2h10]
PCHLRTLSEMADTVGYPGFPDMIAACLFQQQNPGTELPEEYPQVTGRGYSYSSVTATFFAPSELCGTGGMYHQQIHPTPSWQNGPPHYDCAFAEKNPNLPQFQGLYVAQVISLFSFHYHNVYYPCAFVRWFTPIGNEPCPNTGMWMVEAEYDDDGDYLVDVIYLDSILCQAHLIPIYREDSIPIIFNIHIHFLLLIHYM